MKGESPIWTCALHGHADALTVLIENGGDVNQGNIDGAHAVVRGIAVRAHGGTQAPPRERRGREPGQRTTAHTRVRCLAEGTHGGHQAPPQSTAPTSTSPTNEGTPPVWIAAEKGHADALHTLLKAGANARTAESSGYPTLHVAAENGHLPVVRVLAESWPLDRRPWKMFLMGGGAASELQDYLAPPANRTTRNFLPRLYSKPDMVKEIWKYLHKPRYVDVDQLDANGETAAQVATSNFEFETAALLTST